MNLPRTTIKIFASQVLTALFGFLAIIYFTRALPPEELGVFFLFQAILIFSRTVTDFGVSGAVEKRLSETEAYPEILSTSVLLKLGLWAFVSSILIVFGGYIDSYVGAKIVLELVVAIAVREFGELGIRILRGSLRVEETAVIMFGRKFVWMLSSVVLLQFHLGVEAIIYALIFSWTVQIVWVWSKIPIDVVQPNFDVANSLISYSKYFFVDTVGSRVYSWMDLVIIGFFLSKTHVAAYETAWRVAALSFLLTSSILVSVFPQISQWSAEGSTEKISALVSELLGPSVLSILPFFFGALLYGREILGILFGREYTIAAAVLVILIVDKVFQTVYGIFGTTLQAINRPDLSAKATVISIVANFFLNVILVHQLGIVGAAYATAISATVNGVLKYWYLPDAIEISLNRDQILWGVFSSTIMVVTLHSMNRVVQIDSLFKLLAAVATGGILYFAVLLSNPEIRHTFYENIYGRVLA